MWRDSWFVIGAVLACLPCLTPVAVVIFGEVGLGSWGGDLVVVVWAILAALIALPIYRHRLACRRAP